VQPLPGGGNNVPVIQRKSWWQRWRPAVKLTAICTVIGTAGYFAYKWLKR